MEVAPFEKNDPRGETPVLPPNSLVIAGFSTIVEWYDFTLYLYFATVLARVFYGSSLGSRLVTLGGFAIAYLMRPLGAIFFSHIGDRRGRRNMLLISVALMTAAMLTTALLPTRAQVGPLAGWLLFAVRCVMGFSVGGEYTGVVAYLLEGSADRRRGLITSSASAASELGGLLAVAISAATVTLTSESDLASWGWRIPFLIGAALAGSVWIARSKMQESPQFRISEKRRSIRKLPVADAVADHRPAIVRAFSISALGSITYYVGITYVPMFLTSAGGMSERSSLWLSTAAAIAVILVTPLTGGLSDRFGRKPILIGLSVASAALPMTLFSLMAGNGPIAAFEGAIILALLAGAVSAVGAVATAEQFPSEVRVSGLALGATMATALFGGLTPFVAQLLVQEMHWSSAPGIMIAIVAIAVFPLLLLMKETAPLQHRSPVQSG
ncbi:MAG TPA: MFS transporter [Sphingomicrobium sp.]|nr:MFS transporter [Sphingomicrobium sp.]